MGVQKQDGAAPDWELSDEYYQEDAGKKELSLEDFLEEAELKPLEGGSFGDKTEANEELYRVAADVERVLALCGQGKTAVQIAGELGMEASYVSDIMVCIQAFPEDGALAAARLLVMG